MLRPLPQLPLHQGGRQRAQPAGAPRRLKGGHGAVERLNDLWYLRACCEAGLLPGGLLPGAARRPRVLGLLAVEATMACLHARVTCAMLTGCVMDCFLILSAPHCAGAHRHAAGHAAGVHRLQLARVLHQHPQGHHGRLLHAGAGLGALLIGGQGHCLACPPVQPGSFTLDRGSAVVMCYIFYDVKVCWAQC